MSDGYRTERCVCGGDITAKCDDWQDIARAVEVHARTPQHTAYRIGLGYARELDSWGRDGLGVVHVTERADAA